MKKAVLISIRPKWCQKIANGEKKWITIHVRYTNACVEDAGESFTAFELYGFVRTVRNM